MVKIKIKKGLDIPLVGKPSSEIERLASSKYIGLNLSHLYYMRLKLLLSIGDSVKIGQPILLDKKHPDHKFVSPASGVIEEVRRGYKRCIETIVIRLDTEESHFIHEPLDVNKTNCEGIVQYFLKTGLFTHIYKRPFGTIAHPKKMPKSIFIKTFDKAPFAPTPYLEIQDAPEDFQMGIRALSIICPNIHLICNGTSKNELFHHLKNCHIHFAFGPYPISNPSVHIQKIDPITNSEEQVWTLDAIDVIRIGHMVQTGKYFTKIFITLAGPMVQEMYRKHYETRLGISIRHLLENKVMKNHSIRFISGNPLTGKKTDLNGFLGIKDHIVCAFEEGFGRRFLHFIRLKNPFYSFTHTYKIPHCDSYYFNTLKHGEERTFIDPNIYDRVMPLHISTIHLIKSLLSQDYEISEKMGLFEIIPEDFALASFICPSKTEFVSIVEREIQNYIKENVIE